MRLRMLLRTLLRMLLPLPLPLPEAGASAAAAATAERGGDAVARAAEAAELFALPPGDGAGSVTRALVDAAVGRFGLPWRVPPPAAVADACVCGARDGGGPCL
jgi:hypothetical protein